MVLMGWLGALFVLSNSCEMFLLGFADITQLFQPLLIYHFIFYLHEIRNEHIFSIEKTFCLNMWLFLCTEGYMVIADHYILFLLLV